MGWIRVSDDFYDNDKMCAAGSIGRDMYWHGMAFCNRNLTDGLIPKGRALALVDFTDAAVLIGMGGVDGQDCAPVAIARLLGADLWHEDGHDCERCVQPGPLHYIVHDYLVYQPSKADVESKAEANRQRVQKWRDARNASSNGVGNALHTDVVTEHVHDNPNPNPNPSSFTSHEVKEGGRASKDQRPLDEDGLPPRTCPDHPDGTPTRCGACKEYRQHRESLIEARKADELDAKRRQKEARENCPRCEGTNTYTDDQGEAHICRPHVVRLAENLAAGGEFNA